MSLFASAVEGAGTPTGEQGKEKDDEKEEEDSDDVRFATGEKIVTHPAGKRERLKCLINIYTKRYATYFYQLYLSR